MSDSPRPARPHGPTVIETDDGVPLDAATALMLGLEAAPVAPPDGSATLLFDSNLISSLPPDGSRVDGWEAPVPDRSDAAVGNGPPPVRYHWDSTDDLIGHGGVGNVFRAWDVVLRRRVAVKVLHDHHRGSIGVRRRFQREGRIAARLRHHGIPSVYDIGETPDGLPFVAMQLVEGRTLETILRERPDRTADRTRLLTVLLQVAQAIAHAHSQGIIHRDLKPANIMVGGFGVVAVLDWGLAYLIGPAESPDPAGAAVEPPAGEPGARLTREGTVFGTPAYLPPEQAGGRVNRVDRRADVFGLGAILCEVLTGDPPYPGDNEHETLKRAMAADLSDARARLRGSGGPLDLIQLAEKCLRPDPADRYDSAADVAEVIAGYLQSEQRQAERRLARFFELTLDLLCIADMNGYFQEINGNFHAVLGHSADDLTSRPFVSFVHPDDVDKTVRECERLAAGELSVLFENRYKHKDGHYIHLEWNARTVPEEQLIYAVARDVTARHAKAEAHRRAEDHRRHLATAVHSADESIIQLGLDGTVVGWNPGAERLFGYPDQEIIGRRFDALVPAGRPEEVADVLARVRDGGSTEEYEAVRLRRDGTPVDVCVTLAPVRDAAGTVTGVVKVARDISARKRSETQAAECHKAASFFAAAATLLAGGGDLSATLRAFTALAVERLGVAGCHVWTVDEADPTPVRRAGAGQTADAADITAGRVALQRTPLCADAGESEWLRGEGLTAFAGFPLVVGDRLLGVNAVLAREPLSENVVQAVAAVSHALALGLLAHRPAA